MTGLVRGRTDHLVGRLVVGIAAMAEVEPRHVHPDVDELSDLLGSRGRGSEGAHDFCSSHASTLPSGWWNQRMLNRFLRSDHERARRGDDRTVQPRGAGEVGVDRRRGGPALGDRPDDRATARARRHPRRRPRRPPSCTTRPGPGSGAVQRETELGHHRVGLGPAEPERQEDLVAPAAPGRCPDTRAQAPSFHSAVLTRRAQHPSVRRRGTRES